MKSYLCVFCCLSGCSWALAFQLYLLWRETEILFLVLAATSLSWANLTPLCHVGHPIQADRPPFLVLHFIACFLQIEVLWEFFTDWSFMAARIKQVYQHHFSNSICSLCVSVSHLVILAMCQSFSLFFYLLWWSVISDLWCYCWNLGCELHRPCPYKMTNLMVNIVCSDCSTNQLLPISLPLLRPISWDKTIDIRLINNPTVASKCSSERKSHVSHFKSKARNDWA